jgi:hypothetical protein
VNAEADIGIDPVERQLSAADIQQAPMGKESWVGADDPSKPVPCPEVCARSRLNLWRLQRIPEPRPVDRTDPELGQEQVEERSHLGACRDRTQGRQKDNGTATPHFIHAKSDLGAFPFAAYCSRHRYRALSEGHYARGQLGLAPAAFGQDLAAPVVAELAPLADFSRRAEAPNIPVGLAVELADIKTLLQLSNPESGQQKSGPKSWDLRPLPADAFQAACRQLQPDAPPSKSKVWQP